MNIEMLSSGINNKKSARPAFETFYHTIVNTGGHVNIFSTDRNSTSRKILVSHNSAKFKDWIDFGLCGSPAINARNNTCEGMLEGKVVLSGRNKSPEVERHDLTIQELMVEDNASIIEATAIKKFIKDIEDGNVAAMNSYNQHDSQSVKNNSTSWIPVARIKNT